MSAPRIDADRRRVLAGVANKVLGNYQRGGKILQTRSTPRTPRRAPDRRDWLRGNGPQVEQALMAWAAMPSVTSLNRLPPSA